MNFNFERKHDGSNTDAAQTRVDERFDSSAVPVLTPRFRDVKDFKDLPASIRDAFVKRVRQLLAQQEQEQEIVVVHESLGDTPDLGIESREGFASGDAADVLTGDVSEASPVSMSVDGNTDRKLFGVSGGRQCKDYTWLHAEEYRGECPARHPSAWCFFGPDNLRTYHPEGAEASQWFVWYFGVVLTRWTRPSRGVDTVCPSTASENANNLNVKTLEAVDVVRSHVAADVLNDHLVAELPVGGFAPTNLSGMNRSGRVTDVVRNQGVTLDNSEIDLVPTRFRGDTVRRRSGYGPSWDSDVEEVCQVSDVTHQDGLWTPTDEDVDISDEWLQERFALLNETPNGSARVCLPTPPAKQSVSASSSSITMISDTAAGASADASVKVLKGRRFEFAHEPYDYVTMNIMFHETVYRPSDAIREMENREIVLAPGQLLMAIAMETYVALISPVVKFNRWRFDRQYERDYPYVVYKKQSYVGAVCNVCTRVFVPTEDIRYEWMFITGFVNHELNCCDDCLVGAALGLDGKVLAVGGPSKYCYLMAELDVVASFFGRVITGGQLLVDSAKAGRHEAFLMVAFARLHRQQRGRFVSIYEWV